MYTCTKCDKSFIKKTNLVRHEKRKNPCKMSLLNATPTTNQSPYIFIENINKHVDDLLLFIQPLINKDVLQHINKTANDLNTLTDIVSNTCPYCSKEFFQKSNVIKHITTNKCTMKNNINIKIQNEIIIEKFTKIKKIIQEQYINGIKVNNIPINTPINIPVVSTPTHKKLISFETENIHLSKDDITKICTSGTYYPIVTVIVIHCNKNYPEYQNVLISNLRSNTGLMYINNKWIVKSQVDILNHVMNHTKKHVIRLLKDVVVDKSLQLKLETTKQEIVSTESKAHQQKEIKKYLYNASKMIIKNKRLNEKHS